MSLAKRVFTREFKLGVCQQIELKQKTQAQIAREHSLGVGLIHRWLKEYRSNPDGCFSGSSSSYPKLVGDAEKIKQLEQALGRVTLENQILKEAQDILQKKVQQRSTTK